MENIMDNNSILNNLVMADEIMSRSGRKIILTWCLLSSIIIAQNTAYIEIAEADAYPGDNVQVEVLINAEGYTTGNGSFTGEYYNGIQGGSPEFGDLVLVREDFEINFDWGTGSPDSLVQNDYFQVRWTGTIYAHVSGTYYFRSYTDDGLRLFIDEQSVIDEWWDFPPTSLYGQIELEIGVHELEMEYYEMGGGAVAQLYWTPPGSAETIVQPSAVTNLNSAEFQFDGFQGYDVDFTGISLSSTLFSELDWTMQFNNTDTMLYVALAGADGIGFDDLNTMFLLEFHIHDDAAYGDVPIDFSGGILNTESPEWEIEPGGIMVDELAVDEVTLPIQFALYQNYPNPFNPVTTLRYDLPETGLVNIIIYDMLGRQIKALVNQTQDAGYKSVTWDAINDHGERVSAGIYIYQIQAGEYISTKKMVLLK